MTGNNQLFFHNTVAKRETMDRLSQLRAFINVGESGGFSKAAARLGLSKSMISRLIGALESDLGVRLLQRTTRSVTLTEAGRGYLERCRRILADLEDADLGVSRLQAEPRGQLRISAPVSFGIRHLGPALPDFFDRFPEIGVELSLTDRFVDLVEEGVDVAVRIGRLSDSSLIARHLCPVRMAICASPAYFQRRGMPETVAALAGHECILRHDSHGTWHFADGLSVSVSGRLSTNDGDMVRIMALAGCGLAYLPTFFVGRDIREKRLVAVLERFVPQDRALHAVYPHGRHLSPKVRAFVDFLAARFAPDPYWDVGTEGR